MGVVVHIWNPSSWEASQVEHESKASLDYIVRPYLKPKTCYKLLHSEKVLNSSKHAHEDLYPLGTKWTEAGIGNGWRLLQAAVLIE